MCVAPHEPTHSGSHTPIALCLNNQEPRLSAGFLIALLLLVTLFLRRSSAGRVSFIVECICVAVIALATGVGHWVIAARMRALRAAMVLPIDQIAMDDSRRIEFNSLHGYSVNALGLAMIAALVALVLMARSLRN